MIMAKLIVASRIAGVFDLLEDGNTALLCEPSDASDFATKILTLTENSRFAKRLREDARLKAMELYDNMKDQTTVSDFCLLN